MLFSSWVKLRLRCGSRSSSINKSGVNLDMRIGLVEQVEDLRHAPDVFHHGGGDQTVSLTRRPVAAIPVAPKRQEGAQGRIGK